MSGCGYPGKFCRVAISSSSRRAAGEGALRIACWMARVRRFAWRRLRRRCISVVIPTLNKIQYRSANDIKVK